MAKQPTQSGGGTAIPRLQESQPILNPQSVASGAEGLNEFARQLGSLSEKLVPHIESIEQEKSDAMYTNSVADIEKLKAQSYIRLAQNPNAAPNIVKDMKDSVDIIQKNSFVNSADRNKLKKYGVTSAGEVEIHAARKQAEVGIRMAALNHDVNFPDQLAAHAHLLLTNHDQAEILQQKMVSEIHSLVAMGSLSPSAGATQIKMISGTVEHASDIYSSFTGEAPPELLNGLLLDPIHANDPNIHPVYDAHTQWNMAEYKANYSKNMMLAQIANGVIPNPGNYYDLKPSEQAEGAEARHGRQAALGIISGAEGGYPVIEQAAKILSQHGDNLSIRDRWTRDTLNQFDNLLKIGDYNGAMRLAGADRQINQDFADRQAAIDASSQFDVATKARLSMENKDRATMERVAWGHAKGIPDKYIHPIAEADVVQAQTTFDTPGADPDKILNLLHQYSPQNQGYFARSMKTPEQQLMMNVLVYSGNAINDTEKRNAVYAIQNRTYLAHDKSDQDSADDKLDTVISSKLQPQLYLINQMYTGSEAQQYRNALINNTRDLAKFKAGMNLNNQPGLKESIEQQGYARGIWNYKFGNGTLRDYAGFVDDASKIIAASFEPITSTNYALNKKALPPGVDKNDLDHVATYITNQGYKQIRPAGSDAKFDEAVGRNPLIFDLTSTQQAQARDSFGNIYYSMPYNHNMVALAIHESKQAEEEKLAAQKKANEPNVKRAKERKTQLEAAGMKGAAAMTGKESTLFGTKEAE